ncbi:MAG: TolB family protein [Myxococcota bacterium]
MRLAPLVLVAGLCVPLAGHAEDRIAFLAHDGGFWQVWTMAPDGGNQRQISSSQYEKARISWFPSGDEIAVVPLQGAPIRLNRTSGGEERLELGLDSVHDVAVSPDGTTFAVSAMVGEVPDNHDIWIVPARGSGAPRRLVGMPWLQHEPRWTADGRSVVFVSGDGQQDHDIWRVDVASGSREQLTVGSRYHFEVDVAPDGTLAFSSNRSGDYEIYTQHPNKPAVRWTDSPGLDGHPTWSPDGQSLVFHSMRGGVLNLWRQDGPGEGALQLTSFENGARAPEWWSRKK